MYVPAAAYNSPPSGMGMGGAFLSALAPAITSMVPAGSAFAAPAAALGSAIPALFNYQQQQQAAEYANQQRLTALSMADPANNPVPKLTLPGQFTQAQALAKWAPMGEMVGAATAQGANLRSQQADTRARFASNGYQVAPEVQNAVLNNQRLAAVTGGQNQLSSMADQARQSYINTLMSVGGQENSIAAANNQSTEDRLRMMIQLEMGDTNLANFDTSGIMNSINNANQLQLQYAQIDAQKQIARQQMWGSLAGAGIQGASGLAGSAIMGNALASSPVLSYSGSRPMGV